MNEANGMQWWNCRGAVGVGTSSSADDAALNSRQDHGYKSWLDVERIPHKPGPKTFTDVIRNHFRGNHVSGNHISENLVGGNHVS